MKAASSSDHSIQIVIFLFSVMNPHRARDSLMRSDWSFDMLPDLSHSPDPVKSGSLTDFRPTSRSMPETQNFDPVGFKRVHDNDRTFDKCDAKPSYVSHCRGRVIFSDKIADVDKVRFRLSG
jgi:hypothetical protein